MVNTKCVIDKIHVMPTADCIEHIESSDCICSPVQDSENKWDLREGTADKEVWVHNLVLVGKH